MYVVPLITFFAEDSLVSVSDRLMTTSTRTNWAPIWARVWVDVAWECDQSAEVQMCKNVWGIKVRA